MDYRDETIGIVAPIYAGELPHTVRRFIAQMKFHTPYFYLILTYGNEASVAGVWSENFCEQYHIHVNLIQMIQMVDKHEEQQIQEVFKKLSLREKEIPQPTKTGEEIYDKVQKRFQKHPEFMNGEMICMMTSKFVGCTICKQVCPTGNIQIVDGKAQRIAATCDFCLACVHHCPFHAIGLKTEKNPKARYRHPKVTLKDIVKANNWEE